MDLTTELGIIEGYYGVPWSWEDRARHVDVLGPAGYRFFLHAPKADGFLRRRWREDHPAEQRDALTRFSDHCRQRGVRFGLGLSPFELYRNFDAEARATLAAKLAWLDAIGIDDLGILFDDMRGDLPSLAATQADILHFVADHSRASRIIVCPTYYTDDPVLDRFFGPRPENYLEDLGRALDPAIAVFWTGEEVCSAEYRPGHLARVTQQLGRKPFLWDNYPVNDGPRMSRRLHLRAMTGRPASLGAHLTAHAVNPALQPTLSLIPALTLADSYRQGDDYSYGQAFQAAAAAVLGPDLAHRVRGHLGLLQDRGLDQLDPAAIQRLKARYSELDHPAAREIIGFLEGRYAITPEMMQEA